MNVKTNKILIVFLSLSLCLLTYKFCYSIAEKFFFDKFFYQKNVTYGYWLSGKTFRDYAERAQDIISFDAGNFESYNGFFKIAIIGDSYVWGQGIKNNQRFASLLSSQLNKSKITKIYSLAKPGWNVLDYLITYQQVQKQISPDLFIFTLVTNDIYINSSNNDLTLVKKCLQLNDNLSPIYESEDNSQIEQAWLNPTNQCILNESLKILPSDSAIYFLTEDYDNNWNQTKFYKKYLLNNQKYVISSRLGQYLPKYQKYWNQNLWKNFTISTLEGHPNALANQMYTDILYQEITTNPEWGFVKK